MFVLSVQPPEGGGYRGQYVDFMGERCPNDKLPPNKCYKEGQCPGCTWVTFLIYFRDTNPLLIHIYYQLLY